MYNGYILPGKMYDVLKWVGLVVLPALATFVGTVAPSWGMEPALSDAIVTTLNAVGTLFGAVIVVSAATAKPEGGDADA